MANTGGFVYVLWGRADSATVTITGAGTFSPTSPQTITTSQQFTTATDGDYVVTVTQFGRTIATKTITLQGGVGLIINPEPNASQLEDALAPVVSTTAALAAIANAVNTVGKYQGKRVWNSTTSKPVYANAGTAAGTWLDATGTLAHTPV